MEFLNSDNEWEEILESELTINDCNEQLERLDKYYSSISDKSEKVKVWVLIQEVKGLLASFFEKKPHYTGIVYPIFYGVSNKKLLRISSSEEEAKKYIENNKNYKNINYIKVKLDEDLL